MTAWQDEYSAEPSAPDAGGAAGRPTSRRAAREAERRAAETMVEKPPHPSGVVDFEAHDFSAEFTPDQAFDVGDTQDIWQALTRGAQPGAAATAAPFRAEVPEAPPARPADGSAMSGDLMDRVRDAVLRRQTESDLLRAQAEQESALESQSFDRRTMQPRPLGGPQSPRRAAPQPFDAAAHEPRVRSAQAYDPRVEPASSAPQPRLPQAAPSRRERRVRETADLREDGQPSALFAERPPAPQQPAPGLGYDVDDFDDDYYDEPYAPEPTMAIPVRATGAAPRPATNPVGLPQAFAEPAGDDALTFSSPMRQVAADSSPAPAAFDADPEFIEPADPWQDVPQPYAARPVSAPMPFVQPQRPDSQFQEPQLGPPSEMTDLAGFEALIRKARQQPPAPQPVEPAAARPALAWADEDDDEQGGFGTLLNRQVQSSHGTSPALILPDPQPVDLTQAVSGTGDIFITGTMKLSRSLSTTGGHDDAYDSPDIDRLYDVAHDEPAAGVTPVRASKAVSGTPQKSSIVTGRPRRGNVLPTVLAIIAGAMAVGVVTLLVGSWIFRIF